MHRLPAAVDRTLHDGFWSPGVVDWTPLGGFQSLSVVHRTLHDGF